MKTLLLIAMMAIVGSSSFAAKSIETSKANVKKCFTKESTLKTQKNFFVITTCEQKADFNINCGGRMLYLGTYTIWFGCASGVINNQDWYASGKNCNSPQDVMLD